MRRTAGLVLALLVFVHTSGSAFAQPSPQEEPAPAVSESVAAPEPLDVAPPEYPAEARARGIEASLVLRLTIDAEGAVTHAEVLERTEQGFDEAARAALLRSRFKPALKNGRAVAAKILYRVEFRLPPEPPAEPAAPSEAEPVPAPLPVAPPASPGEEPEPVEVSVAGTRSEAERLERSAAPVTVVELTRLKRRSSDLGEIMARTFGVSVRRSGGLGSDTRFSLNGLQEDQLRLFQNAIPLEHSFPGSIANIPVNLLDRVEIYRGVVPVRYASDALGGAVNLVTDQNFDTRFGGSYQLGSFGMRRATLLGRYHHPATGLVVGVEAFGDAAKNDYPVDVQVPDERGRLQPATVKRFHDRYRAYGVALDAGVVNASWARRLILRGLRVAYDKQLQHNLVMSVPYGEVTYGEALNALQLQYEHTLAPRLDVELRGSYGHISIDYSDQSEWVYDWYGRRGQRRRSGGELDTRPHDQTVWQHSAFGRLGFQYRIARGHRVRLATSSDFGTRSGDERIQVDPTARDPLTAERVLFKQVTGLEYELGLFEPSGPPRIADADERFEHVLQNIFFVKDYVYVVESEEPIPGGFYRERDQRRHRFGIGDGIRVLLTDFLFVKASYELATRLPRAEEVFGDAVLVQANLELDPEVSNNANLGARLDLEASPVGDFTLDVNAFLRDTKDQIVLLGNDRYFTYQNVYRARSSGIEGAFEWIAPGRILACDGSFTWIEQRNLSNQGTFADFKGDRIPNRPYLQAAFGARARLPHVLHPRDEIEPFYTARYVHEFFRSWESVGLVQYKQVIPSQLVHGAGLTYTLRGDRAFVATTLEVQNFTDAKAFDNYGVQRPGRGFYAKVTTSTF